MNWNLVAQQTSDRTSTHELVSDEVPVQPNTCIKKQEIYPVQKSKTRLPADSSKTQSQTPVTEPEKQGERQTPPCQSQHLPEEDEDTWSQTAASASEVQQLGSDVFQKLYDKLKEAKKQHDHERCDAERALNAPEEDAGFRVDQLLFYEEELERLTIMASVLQLCSPSVFSVMITAKTLNQTSLCAAGLASSSRNCGATAPIMDKNLITTVHLQTANEASELTGAKYPVAAFVLCSNDDLFPRLCCERLVFQRLSAITETCTSGVLAGDLRSCNIQFGFAETQTHLLFRDWNEAPTRVMRGNSEPFESRTLAATSPHFKAERSISCHTDGISLCSSSSCSTAAGNTAPLFLKTSAGNLGLKKIHKHDSFVRQCMCVSAEQVPAVMLRSQTPAGKMKVDIKLHMSTAEEYDVDIRIYKKCESHSSNICPTVLLLLYSRFYQDHGLKPDEDDGLSSREDALIIYLSTVQMRLSQLWNLHQQLPANTVLLIACGFPTILFSSCISTKTIKIHFYSLENVEYFLFLHLKCENHLQHQTSGSMQT
ncbi:hypothetical protein EXN66_Car008141 [Channa argus]|uniref:Uncharacterized protein n=1 Tax=Channa argus TaxID=215402 RepID=A0A6G1PQA9_CHAAH|nr:hypothetical protein EXN66_Car008141 [Channa argus]